MGCCCCLPNKKKSALGKNESSICSPVVRSKLAMEAFLTNKERTAIINDPSTSVHLKLLLSAPFSNISAFDERVFFTGIGGITLDNLKQYNIKCLVNVAEEIRSISIPSNQPSALLYYKFPLLDSGSLSSYFNEVTEVIQKALKQNDGNCIIYCTAGMCRSSTIVLAYAIKYKKTNLRDAFTMVQGARNYARPNLTLFQHLVQYEKECLGTNSVEMVQVTTDFEETKKLESNKAGGKKKKLKSNNELITVPNFYKKQYPHLFKLEVSEYRVGNCLSLKSGTKSKNLSADQVKSMASKGTAGHQSAELKPFAVETISYEAVLSDLEKARRKKVSLCRAVPAKSLKTKY